MQIEMQYNHKQDSLIIKSAGLKDVVLKSSVGAKSLYHLINNPNRSFSPILLRNITKEEVNLSNMIKEKFEITSREDQLLYQSIHQYIPASDMKTIIECRKRLKVILEELREADFNNDIGRSETLVEEKEFIEKYIHDSVSANGSFRNLNNSKRNATKALQRNIRNVLNEIDEQSPEIYKFITKRLIVSTNQIKYYPDNDYTSVD